MIGAVADTPLLNVLFRQSAPVPFGNPGPLSRIVQVHPRIEVCCRLDSAKRSGTLAQTRDSSRMARLCLHDRGRSRVMDRR
jgi:hypothetical protein